MCLSRRLRCLGELASQEVRTVSSARPLASTERIAELARMLGGAKLTKEAREHAEQLLRQVRAPSGRGAPPVT